MAANNLSELYLTLGDVVSAQKYGTQSVSFADRSGDGFQMESKRTTHADTLYQAGKNKAAEKLFIEAENMQKKRTPDYPYLYSLWGFRFCDLLLSKGKYQEVLERARTTIKIANQHSHLISIALDNLTIGKALMQQALSSPGLPPIWGDRGGYLNQAVDGLREAGTQHNLPWGLLARASLFRHQKDFLKSWADLDEAKEIAEYGQMRLHLTDYHLEAARLIQAQLKESKSKKEFTIIEDGIEKSVSKKEMGKLYKEFVDKAGELIKETGYHRRDEELGLLR